MFHRLKLIIELLNTFLQLSFLVLQFLILDVELLKLGVLLVAAEDLVAGLHWRGSDWGNAISSFNMIIIWVLYLLIAFVDWFDDEILSKS